jgi:CubicO group peptidase (beta-lactamase class C family)
MKRWILAHKRLALVTLAVAIAVIAAFGPGGSGPATPSDAAAMRYVRSHRLDLGTPGIAVGIVHGTATSVAATGDARTDTPFIVGSATKSFTALAVMQLVEAGRVRLDDPAVRYVPDFATGNRAVSDRITVRQLLSHTSGISTAAGVDPLADPPTTLHRQVLALSRVVAAKPGTFIYSNANYEVLGDLIEHVTGGPYAQYLQAHVLAPLGMRHTYTDLASARAAGLRGGHKVWFGVGLPSALWYRADFLPAGFLVSTVEDLNHFLSAMLNGGRYEGGSVLSEAGVAAMTGRSAAASLWGVRGGYGFGWYQRPTGGLALRVDPGIARNTHADLVLVPDRQVGAVVLANAESDLYLTSFPKIDLLAMNVAAIAATGSAPVGLIEGLYLIFDLIVLAAIAGYLLGLLRLVRARVPGYAGRRWYRRAFMVWREILVPAVLLLRLPDVTQEPWSHLVKTDIGVAALAIAVLGLAPVALRLWFWYAGRRPSPGDPPPAVAHQPDLAQAR